jgi:plasmid maintenance system antidote protein VapI
MVYRTPSWAAPLAIGDQIRQTLKAKHLTVERAADQLGVSRVLLSRVLGGQGRLSVALAVALQRQFGLDAYDLLNLQLKAAIEHTRRYG